MILSAVCGYHDIFLQMCVLGLGLKVQKVTDIYYKVAYRSFKLLLKTYLFYFFAYVLK